MPTSSEIRQQFLDFFSKKCGHAFVPSSPVVPHDDPTLLFANAGMNQFKPYFLGTEKPKHVRVVNTQKCIRAGGKHNDLDDVGKDTYHHTFFEMLGNWSFGDYFKKDAISWAWELLTVVWKLDPSRLHVTVFEGDSENGIPQDDEAAEIWKSVGVQPGHIHLGNKKDNFWEMGATGPCGPCTEIHFDRTPDKSGAKLVNGGSDQCIEIWNNVFIQFNRNEDKSLTPLPAQHVDTGMGFERICAVLNDKPSNYDTDVFTPIFTAIQNVTSKRPYGGKLDDLTDTAYRVIADHIRSLTFAISDGATPGNKGRSAVLRSILRRASRYGWQVFGIQEPFLHRLSGTVVEQLGGVFPELNRNPEKVREVIYEEERGFLKTLDKGIKLFAQAADRAAVNQMVVSGKDAFDLHTTFGLDIGITQQMAQEQGLSVDMNQYKQLWDDFTKKSDAGGKGLVITAVQGELPKTDDSPKYDTAIITAKVLGWVKDSVVIRTGTLTPGDTVGLLLDRTNFYAEQGGQVGDTGVIDKPETTGIEFRVDNTLRLGETVLHVGVMLAGQISVGETVQLLQSTFRRIDVMRNHTATHLLNLALRSVLGSHVEQKGSLVDDEKTRFDFNHDKPVTQEELRGIESRVNQLIGRDQPVIALTMPLEQAKKLAGVRAVFGEKYPDPVRVVLIGPESPEKATPDDSIEFCGGTHMPSTGAIGYFKVVSQESVAKGIRRITATTGRVATETLAKMSTAIDDLTGRFQCAVEEIPARIDALQDELKKLKGQLTKAQLADLSGVVDQLLAAATEVNGTKVVVGQLPGGTVEQVRTQIDRVRQKCASAFVTFIWEDDGKVPVILALSPDLVKKGMKAGELVKGVGAVVGGSGGGKPDLAQAGGKDPARIPDALKRAMELASETLK
jgi:alanyl-tRNA synthetase